MNFLRRVLHDTTNTTTDDDNGEEEEADRLGWLLQNVKDPVLDAAIAAMRERLDHTRAQTLVQRETHRQEREDLWHTYRTARKTLYDRLDHNHVVLTTPTTPYMTATKQVRDYIVPGVVALLQAQLCLHVHALCAHNEQLVVTQKRADELIWWYQDMRTHLQQDQAHYEWDLMNQIVQAQLAVGALVDRKQLLWRERLDERRAAVVLDTTSSDKPTTTILRRNLSRSISRPKESRILHTHDNNNNSNMPRRVLSRRIMRSHSGGRMSMIQTKNQSSSSSSLSPTAATTTTQAVAAAGGGTLGMMMEPRTTNIRTGHRQRVVRKMSRQGTALRTNSRRSSSTPIRRMTAWSEALHPAAAAVIVEPPPTTTNHRHNYSNTNSDTLEGDGPNHPSPTTTVYDGEQASPPTTGTTPSSNNTSEDIAARRALRAPRRGARA